MSYPKREIAGQIYTCGGDVVVAGTIEAWLVPPGSLVLDSTGSPIYKVGARETGIITTVGIQSFSLTAMQSMSPLDAYYQIKFSISNPVEDVWYELWRITGTGTLVIGSITPLAYGPSLSSGYTPIRFTA